MTTPHAFPLEPASIQVSDEVLDDLRARLALTRPPLDEDNEDWFYGVPDSYLRDLVATRVRFPWAPHRLSDINFWKVADLWHTLMTEVLRAGHMPHCPGSLRILLLTERGCALYEDRLLADVAPLELQRLARPQSGVRSGTCQPGRNM